MKSGGELMVGTWKAAAFMRLYFFVNEQGWVVALDKELSYNCSYFQKRYLGTLVTSVTVTCTTIYRDRLKCLYVVG